MPWCWHWLTLIVNGTTKPNKSGSSQQWPAENLKPARVRNKETTGSTYFYNKENTISCSTKQIYLKV